MVMIVTNWKCSAHIYLELDKMSSSFTNTTAGGGPTNNFSQPVLCEVRDEVIHIVAFI